MKGSEMGRLGYVLFFVIWLNCANVSHNELNMIIGRKVYIFCRYRQGLYKDIGSL
ncbi:hypothetical protein PTE_03428 [Photorhabdus khanii NC19]|uniref:Uncharacterized protein n=1 Tax=Photorhabdus khanii NC19 TaxID=1004151 RepID=W3V2Q7_9GAMM|nr:hypothetical protein PTE_03428 [Photorhabdus khanii NC19]